MKETRLEPVFGRNETHEDMTKAVYRPKSLLAYAAAAKEYVKLF